MAQDALEAGLALRLMGGLAIWLSSESVRRPPYAREYADMDFAASGRQQRAVKQFFESQGYVPEKLFNAMHGAQRLNYAEPDGRWTVDVVFDALRMSHQLDLRSGLTAPIPTIPLADLLLTKLQIWEVNRKDLGDALCLLADHAIGLDDNSISPDRIAGVLGSDWGFCHTVERNLGKVEELWSVEPAEGARFDVGAQMYRLRQVIDAAPKTLAWRSRARVGERLRWYETPEEVRHL